VRTDDPARAQNLGVPQLRVNARAPKWCEHVSFSQSMSVLGASREHVMRASPPVHRETPRAKLVPGLACPAGHAQIRSMRGLAIKDSSPGQHIVTFVSLPSGWASRDGPHRRAQHPGHAVSCLVGVLARGAPPKFGGCWRPGVTHPGIDFQGCFSPAHIDVHVCPDDLAARTSGCQRLEFRCFRGRMIPSAVAASGPEIAGRASPSAR
jgi:hypothetical protein